MLEKSLGDQGLSVVEEAGIAFDPTTQVLDLSKDEKRRVTALFMAINAYQNLIIKDADYLKEASDQARRGEGPKIQPATMDAMVAAAIRFDDFIAGKYSEPVSGEDVGQAEQVDAAGQRDGERKERG